MMTSSNEQEVAQDVGYSGTQWIGEHDSRDEEMRPGSECQGNCHLKTDGPPQVAAGTVYAVHDNAEQIVARRR